jgi:hypothetical protein
METDVALMMFRDIAEIVRSNDVPGSEMKIVSLILDVLDNPEIYIERIKNGTEEFGNDGDAAATTADNSAYPFIR